MSYYLTIEDRICLKVACNHMATFLYCNYVKLQQYILCIYPYHHHHNQAIHSTHPLSHDDRD